MTRATKVKIGLGLMSIVTCSALYTMYLAIGVVGMEALFIILSFLITFIAGAIMVVQNYP